MWCSLMLEKLKVKLPGKVCRLVKEKPRYSKTRQWNDEVRFVVMEEKKSFQMKKRRGCETDRD